MREHIHNVCNPIRNTCNPTRNLTSHPSGKLILVGIDPFFLVGAGVGFSVMEGLEISKDAVPCCINIINLYEA